jgi:hypothetical protein
MSDNHRTAGDRDTRIENFVAELTGAAYALVLGRGLKGSWLEAELDLWWAIAATVKRWAGEWPAAAPSDELEAWREGLLADLTESAFCVALKNGIEGPLLDLELGLYRAVRLVTSRYSWVRQSE